MAEGLGGDTAQVGAQPPFEENLQLGGHGSIEENMSNVRLLLVEQMDPDFGLLDKLLQLGALTYPETVQIRGEKSIFDRNDKLLEMIFNKMKHQALLTSLTETGQKHLFNLVTGNGGYRAEYGTVWPLGERKTQILDVNRINLVDKICPSELITSMFSNGVLNYRQQEYISSLCTLTEKAGALLDILRRGSEEYYSKTITCLRESKQGHVAELLLEGGVLARVHVSNEGETEKVNEEEDHVLEAFKALLQNTTSPQLQRMRELLDLQIMGAAKGHSIVFYIYCRTLEELLYLYELLTKGEFKKCIAAVFDLLISKRETTVSAVNWSEDEFTRFKAYFDGKDQHDEKAIKQQQQQSPDPPKQREAEEKRGDEDVGSQIKSLKVEGISKELPTEAARDVSPTRREPRCEAAYTVFSPDEKKRQTIQRQADEEARKHEEYKKANRPHYNYVGTVGGGEFSSGTSSEAVTQRKLPAQGPNLTPMQKSQKYRQEEKLRKEREFEQVKQTARQKTNENEKRDKEREERLRADERRARAAFVARFEEESSGNTPGRPADASSSSSGTSASASGGVKEGNEMPEFVDGLKRLENMFPWVEKDVLKSLLSKADNKVDDVAQFLSQ